MNKEWSEINKTMQAQISKKDTWLDGVDTLISLRNQLMDTLLSFKDELTREDFDAMPYINADGYHSKNIAYSIWHIFRIEDIVAHTLVAGDEQVFFNGEYQKRINSPIITTGNEFIKEQISDFTKQLDIDELYSYIQEVKKSTEEIVRGLSYDMLKQKVSEDRKNSLISQNVVSTDEEAYWLIDYWCGKDIRGLIQMPFSRHWIMHIEASLRIKNKI
ncbi:MAG: phage head-tail adapter protein [Eubacterium sp.]|nr:phage head-tail adapter protein [Eubacterium sp.]